VPYSPASSKSDSGKLWDSSSRPTSSATNALPLKQPPRKLDESVRQKIVKEMQEEMQAEGSSAGVVGTGVDDSDEDND
jgi:hypothetical protein